MQKDNHWRLDHTGIGVADIHTSAKFYDSVLASSGLHPLVRLTRSFGAASGGDDPELAGVGYGVSYPIFWIDVFHPHSVKQHIAFRALSRTEVEAF
ncbi:VOC family protein [Methylobacterium oryzisoli]|uniref:VOC family protein n=1 Tax=Methylobacterium oryzisoli TaxID=3385502 RepID=UPI00397840CA